VIDDLPRPRSRFLLGDLTLALFAAVGGSVWLAWLHPIHGGTGAWSPSIIAGAVTAASQSLPLVLFVVPVTLMASRRGHHAVMVMPMAAAVAGALAVSVSHQAHLAVTASGSGGLALTAATTADASMLLLITVPICGLTMAMRDRTACFRVPRALLVLGIGAVTLVGSTGLAPATAAPLTVRGNTCLDGGAVDRSFDVTAIDVDIPVNRFGDHDPAGKMYALSARVPAIRAQEASQRVSSGLGDDPIQPLVIRANEGDCIEVVFSNAATGGDFGVHIDGLDFNAGSSGDSIGANAPSGVAPGGSVTYRYSIPLDPALEGGHYLHPGPGYRAAVDHGLFGALVVEPPGSTYWDAGTSHLPLQSGWEAIIKPMGMYDACVPTSHVETCGFREAALLHHEIGNDNESLTDKNGALLPIIDDTTGSYRPGGFALNYRSEPFRNRLLDFPKEKSHGYSSYTFGDPATPIMRGYLADPTKIRLMHAGAEKFHVFHLHGGGDRWRFNPLEDSTFNYAQTGLQKDGGTSLSPSQRLDSQSIGPGESYNLELEGGAGGVQQSVGDFLFHCHIAKHYVSGMWGLWRVYDTRQPDLVPIADRTAPPGAVDSRGLLGRTINGTKIGRSNIDEWVRAQLPPQGIPRDGQDATVWDWKVVGSDVAPLFLGAPADPTVYPDSAMRVAGQPNLQPLDLGRIVENRPAILFNPRTGRPAYPLLRTHIGKRPPFTGSGHGGSPYLGNTASLPMTRTDDPWAKRADGLCPSKDRLRKYNVVAITKPIQRTPTVTDAEGKIFVLAKNKAAEYATTKGEPLAIRANVGDCVGLTLTSEIPDASVFDGVSKTSMHIHHVQFDVQGSDGVSAGFAYEHSVRPYQVEDPTLLADAAAGTTVLRLSDVSKLVGLDANGHDIKPWIAVGEGLESIDIHQVSSVDVAASTVTLTKPLVSSHATGEFAGTEFIQYRWYPDDILDNVFWHDHVDGIHGWGHGLVGQLIVEPAGSTYHDPVTGEEVDSGTLVDIHTTSALSPGLVEGSFRELALWTINDNDQSAYSTLNLKSAPLTDRPDKANQFSSFTYGDPLTPLPRLYSNDPLVVRTISISPTVDTLHLQGGRTLIEPRYTVPDAEGNPVPEGTLVDTVHYGISEKFSLIFNGKDPTTKMRPGDYLYGDGPDFRAQQGAWGIVRILPGDVSDLKPLPGIARPAGTYTLPVSTGGPPPAATSAGNPCPPGAPPRTFDITAMSRSGGAAGGRTAFVPDFDVAAVQKRTKPLTPLVLHVVAGDCITVNLTNALANPVSFSVGKVDREQGSGGVNVGFSPDQNAAPNGNRRYVFYVPSERIGSAPIADLAGGPPAGTGLPGVATLKQGLYGVLVVAPASPEPGAQTTFRSAVTGGLTSVGANVVVNVPGGSPANYRDFTVTMADDDVKIGQDFMPYPTNANAGASLINYQAAPAGDGPTSFRDPGSVPWLTSYAGDPVMVHVMVTPGSEQSHVFSLGGMRWPSDQFMHLSQSRTAQGLGPWETIDAKVSGGAGGTAHAAADYFYGDLRRPFTQAGLWGLQRVLPADSLSCAIRRVDGSGC
jgi:FtsP/CotA-like multicopper oxidase with cupredoxin domain